MAIAKYAVLVFALAALLSATQAKPDIKHAVRGTRPPHSAVKSAEVKVLWKQTLCELKTVPTFQVVVNSLLERSSPVHDQIYESLSMLKTNYIRYVPWLPYPKLGVAELEPPTANHTSWNFTLIDPLMEDFMKAAGNSSVIINFSTPPTWMYDTQTWAYPDDPDRVQWDYEQGTKLKDASAKQFAEYYSRLVQWYTKGGFKDENGKFHSSGKFYNIQMWEVLNEVEAEHKNTPESYTIQYDAMVSELLALHPEMKFVGMALAFHNEWNWYEYFLNSSNHKANIPIDWISYHFYGTPSDRYNPLAYEEIYPAADSFVTEVKKIEEIRKRLSPTTKTTINEIGTILPDDNSPNHDPPLSYWPASAGMYAYLFNELSKQGIDVLGQSQLVGYPAVYQYKDNQYPSVALLDWNTGYGNPRYWTLRMLLEKVSDHKHKMVETSVSSQDIAAQGYVRDDGREWMVLINKRYSNVTVTLHAEHVAVTMIDEHTFGEFQPPAFGESSKKGKIDLHMAPFAVAFIDF